jgi:integrase
MTSKPIKEWTPAQVRDLEPGAFVTLAKTAPQGSLQARKSVDGVVSLFWRYNVTVAGKLKQSREPIGRFDASLPPKSLKPIGDRYSLAAAVRAAEALAEAHVAKRDEGGMLAIRAAARVAREEAALTAQTDAAMTLSKLVHAYKDYAEECGKKKTVNALKSALKCHIDPRPEAHQSARLQTIESINAIFVPIYRDGGKLDTANKVRSYICTAYELAKRAKAGDGNVPARFKDFNITTNIAAQTYKLKPEKKVDEKGKIIRPTRARPKALTPEQFRAYWRIVEKVQGQRGKLLRLHLFTGGQREAQLVRLDPKEIEAEKLTLWDIKGRSGEAREIVLPITPQIREALEGCAMTGDWAFPAKVGDSHVHEDTLCKWAKKEIAAAESKKDRELLAGFSPKRIRAGVETVLDDAGFPKDDRYALQSHGAEDAKMAKFYNAAEGLNKKRKALETLYKICGVPPVRVATTRGNPSKVVPMRPNVARKAPSLA